MTLLLPPIALLLAAGQWHSTKATFYGNPYDTKPSRYRCADGTPYRSDGAFCATRLVPIGTVIEVKRGSKVLRLVVRDTQAKRFGHLIDVPNAWMVGQPLQRLTWEEGRAFPEIETLRSAA